MLPINKIYNMDCLEGMKLIDDNSIDSIVTDPPYELGFMGKKWDSTGIAYNVELWQEALRVLKPGGHLLAFGGTRTYHRMACAIEDAGFQVRDMIQWIYGCLDEATEILTNQGWKNYREINKSYKIACFDKENEEISYCEPEEIYIYDFDGEMIRIKGRTLDQMLTPNHRVLLKEMKEKGHRENNFYETEWIFKEAKDLTPNRGIRLPLAGDYKGIKSIGLDMAELLGWIISEGTFNENNNAIYICQTERYPQNIDRIRLLLNKLDLFDNEYVGTYPYKNTTYTRHDFYISKEKSKIIKSLIPDKKPTMELLELKHEELLALFNGLVGGDGLFKANSNETLGEFYQKDNFVLDWFQILCLHLGFKSSKNVNKNSVCFGKKSWAKIDAGWFKKKIYKENYKGDVWCVKVPTGAFVVRRNGKVFITGNSGFPKSMDISKAIDKKLGAVREVVGQREDILKKQAKDLKEGKRKIVDSLNAGASERNNGFINVSADITTPTTDEAKQWDGWGTALKPANEPIVVARKPISEKTVAENVLKWGTGGLNIDGCRIESGGEHKRAYQPTNHERGVYGKQTAFQPSNKEGRFPANVILDEEAGRIIDEQSGINTNTRHMSYKRSGGEFIDGIPSQPEKDWFTQETGGASRFFFNVEQDDLEDLIPFFYCAKASKKERGEGNTHPTVKPLKLISYLITLVTPPNGICLDIFEGSGTHALACIENGFKYIGFELDKHYFDIATKRISNHHEQLKIVGD